MMKPFPIALACALSLSACQYAAEAPADAAPTAAAVASGPEATASAEAAPATDPAAKARAVKESNDLLEFEYAYPAAAAAYPPLRDALEKKLTDARTELMAESRNDQTEAKKDGYPYRPHSFGAEWKVVTELPRWLSLSSDFYTYSGGAHGMSGNDTLLWDKQAATVRMPMDLFVSKDALRYAIRDPFCDALDKERAKRRGEPVNRDSGNEFDECIDATQNTAILGSSNGRTFDRIGVLVGPYAAGAYAEGTYEITLPVTQAVLDAVKPAYRDSFAARR